MYKLVIKGNNFLFCVLFYLKKNWISERSEAIARTVLRLNKCFVFKPIMAQQYS